MPDPPDPADLLALARDCAARAGELLLEHFSSPAREVRSKSEPRDLVSAADLAAEETIRGLLAERRPGDGVLGEEGEEKSSETGLRWVVDPLDGTLNFLHRIPHWSVSIACEDSEGPLAGVVFDPIRGEWFAGARGQGATRDRDPLEGSRESDLSLAALGGEFRGHTPEHAEDARRVLTSVGHVRSYGSAALDLAWVAAGRFDAVYYGRFPSPWDIAAGIVLCREAGLLVETVQRDDEGPPHLLAAPEALAGPLRDALRTPPEERTPQ